MAKRLQLRRGTTAQHSTFTGANGEVTIDTTKKTAVVHDGIKSGGFPVLSESKVKQTTGISTTDLMSQKGITDKLNANGTINYNNLANKPTLGTASTKNVGTNSGNVMEVGSFGLGDTLSSGNWNDISTAAPYIEMGRRYGIRLYVDATLSPKFLKFRTINNHVISPSTITILHSANTTVDGNGFIKQASPIIQIKTNDFELSGFENYTTKPTVNRLEKGIYEILNTQGLSSNGWYIETPKNRNGEAYFNVDYTQNIPQPINEIETPVTDIIVTLKVYARVWNPQTGLHENGELIDINDLQHRYVSMRFNDVKVEHEPIEEPTDETV